MNRNYKFIHNPYFINALLFAGKKPIAGNDIGAWFLTKDITDYLNHKEIISMCGANRFID